MSDSYELMRKLRSMIPPLLASFHKGDLGRIAVIGGSESYTGAPYFSAMAAAKLGADLLHVICTPEAAQVIKTYSPNLMIHPLLRERGKSGDHTKEPADILSSCAPLLRRMHVIVVGPGLGRDPLMQATAALIIEHARELAIPIVVDADGLYLLQENPKLVYGYLDCVLTPNVVEFRRLAQALQIPDEPEADTGETKTMNLSRAFGGVSVLRKGEIDWVSNGASAVSSVLKGSRKRSGGQGDTLTGIIATLLAWRSAYHQQLWDHSSEFSRAETIVLAAWGGSHLTRACSQSAFEKHGRSMQASDLTAEVHASYSSFVVE